MYLLFFFASYKEKKWSFDDVLHFKNLVWINHIVGCERCGNINMLSRHRGGRQSSEDFGSSRGWYSESLKTGESRGQGIGLGGVKRMPQQRSRGWTESSGIIVTVGTEAECRQLATRVLFTLLCILTMRAKEYSPERTKSKVDCEANRVGWRWGKQSWGKTNLNELKPEEWRDCLFCLFDFDFWYFFGKNAGEYTLLFRFPEPKSQA